MKGKLIFMDIDGTLMNRERHVPESAKKAISLARENGHRLFICTGRAIGNVDPNLIALGFDGVVACAGACVRVDGREIFRSTFEPEKLKIMVEILREHHAAFYFQGACGAYIVPEERDRWIAFLKANGLNSNRVFHVDETLHNWEDLEGGDFAEADITVEEMQKIADERTAGYFDITGASFGTDHIHNGEVTRKGVTKGSGMEQVVRYYGMSQEDTIGIGDGPNDFDMLKYAKIGVAMGNGVEKLKEQADYVTDTIDNDGIWKAFKALGLI